MIKGYPLNIIINKGRIYYFESSTFLPYKYLKCHFVNPHHRIYPVVHIMKAHSL